MKCKGKGRHTSVRKVEYGTCVGVKYESCKPTLKDLLLTQKLEMLLGKA